jgi:hypothetical protein
MKAMTRHRSHSAAFKRQVAQEFVAGECAFQSPFWKLDLQGLAADHPLECSDLGFILLQQVGGLHVVIERPGLILADPDADQLTRDVVSLR